MWFLLKVLPMRMNSKSHDRNFGGELKECLKTGRRNKINVENGIRGKTLNRLKDFLSWKKRKKKLGILRFHIHARLNSVMLSEAMPIKHFIHFTEQWTSILVHRETS